jgi:hypothetical protein
MFPNHILRILTVLAWGLLPLAGRAKDYAYTAIDPPGSTNTQPIAINSSGQVVGWYYPVEQTHWHSSLGLQPSAEGKMAAEISTVLATTTNTHRSKTREPMLREPGCLCGNACFASRD